MSAPTRPLWPAFRSRPDVAKAAFAASTAAESPLSLHPRRGSGRGRGRAHLGSTRVLGSPSLTSRAAPLRMRPRVVVAARPAAAAHRPGRHRGRRRRRGDRRGQRRGGAGRAGGGRHAARGGADARRAARRLAAHPARRHGPGRRARLPRLLPALLHVARRAAPDRPGAGVPPARRGLPGAVAHLGARRPHRAARGAAAEPAGALRPLPQPRSARPVRLGHRARLRAPGLRPRPDHRPVRRHARRGVPAAGWACRTGRRRCCSRRSPARSSRSRELCRPAS